MSPVEKGKENRLNTLVQNQQNRYNKYGELKWSPYRSKVEGSVVRNIVYICGLVVDTNH